MTTPSYTTPWDTIRHTTLHRVGAPPSSLVVLEMSPPSDPAILTTWHER